MVAALKIRLQERWLRWLDKRIPPAASHQLDLKNVFIFPSRFGWLFVALCISLFILGTNYQNNLMLLLCFWLVGVLLINLHASYWNFARLQLAITSFPAGYAGDTVKLKLTTQLPNQRRRAHGRLLISVLNNTAQQSIDLDTANENTYRYELLERGVHHLPRLTFESYFPLGIFRCWTHLDFAREVVVFPKPQPCQVNLIQQADALEEGGNALTTAGSEDFAGLSQYVAGDNINRVAWKQVAKQQQWLSKRFESTTSASGWLRLAVIDSGNLEHALSELAYQVNQCSQQNVRFGLQLGNMQIPPEQGEGHRLACLRALAYYPDSPGN
ncbi:DUF58 domain-containing protein [Alteromonas flava]|uniref:DUF58 domain-containing protein n=1 Tax=Alteromonas flava TaxID=2048003 RepID=UPI000C286763|nr:DUF58 domain-containing protein [Alteromonas flava]